MPSYPREAETEELKLGVDIPSVFSLCLVCLVVIANVMNSADATTAHAEPKGDVESHERYRASLAPSPLTSSTGSFVAVKITPMNLATLEMSSFGDVEK